VDGFVMQASENLHKSRSSPAPKMEGCLNLR
jgi:hypothetical protein